jgi:hypothetical protein
MRIPKDHTTYIKDKPGTCSATIRGIDRAAWERLLIRCVKAQIKPAEAIRRLIGLYASGKVDV